MGEESAKSPRFDRLEILIVQDRRLAITLFSFLLILGDYVNLRTAQSYLFGIPITALYFLINSVFLGHALVRGEPRFIRLILGFLFLILLLGFAGWLVITAYNISVEGLVLVLAAVSALSSALNRRMRDGPV